MHVAWPLKFVAFYFRDVYEFLLARRYVTAKILAEESLEGLCRDNGLPCSSN